VVPSPSHSVTGRFNPLKLVHQRQQRITHRPPNVHGYPDARILLPGCRTQHQRRGADIDNTAFLRGIAHTSPEIGPELGQSDLQLEDQMNETRALRFDIDFHDVGLDPERQFS
jgi:hypothetical protein